ncbi:MAG: VOC family protein [Nitrospira sp.]|mgnify:FL=1|nr:VOC family protein [Nitrospira sp.]MBX3342561.1 VOC family protein [Nitrospira sp.]MBX7037910.1 VOC family protein [Nitrospira sp.]MCW5795108.1 VOC family protein [Nitrospira sp.]HMU31036.1 VOC family protein [Nitrospira sp.]
MKVPFTLGAVWHFGLAVRDPRASAKWFMRVAGLSKQFEYEGGVGIGNANVLIVFSKGKPSPKTVGHVAFHLPTMAALKKALAHLKKLKVQVEDPGDEIGPVAPGSKSMGIWFSDPDGYRWELAVQSKK